MNIDDLANKILSISNDKIARNLANLLIDWKDNKQTAEQLKETVEKYFGNVWFQKKEDHSKIYKLWSSFKKDAIESIGGMTMNERLYWFGLFDHFDACPDDKSKLNIYIKLHAAP